MQTKNKQPFLKIIFFVIGQILSITLMAQSNLRFEKLEMNDAPSIVSVDCIFEDSRGFMWFGTYRGLIIYDGYKATKFEHNLNDPLSISDNKIRKIYEDRANASKYCWETIIIISFRNEFNISEYFFEILNISKCNYKLV